MRIKTILISMLWLSIAHGNEAPPGLPFQPAAEDPASATQHQGVEVVGGLGNTPASNQGANNPSDNRQPLDGVMRPQPENRQSSEQTEEPAVEQTGMERPTAKPKSKSKKRPKLLDKPLETPANTEAKKKGLNSDILSGIVIKPKPGKTESVVIARGKLNRIVTPYPDPKVLTVDAVETKVDGSIVYIATNSETPVSLFISDSDSGNAASLQLSPQPLLTAVEIRIDSDQGRSLPGGENDSGSGSKLFRQDSPYITEVKAIMQTLGKQQIPQGFTLEEVTEEIKSMTVCHDPKLTFWPGQALSGHDSRIIVFIAQNNSATATVFEEASCASDRTIAIAAWPKVRLEPGERTEVFILMRQPDGKNGEEIRPALLEQSGSPL